MTAEISRVFDIVYFAREKYSNKMALAGKKGGKWKYYSQQEFIDQANYVSSALLHRGIGKGDNIVNISDNRPEWNFLDIGLLQIGAVHVPVFPTISQEEMTAILKEVNPRLIFVSSRFLSKRINQALGEEAAKKIISFDNAAEDTDVVRFADMVDEGRLHMNSELLEKHKSNVRPEDLASIIYTSGTTTMPKGVMLSHRNHVANIEVTAAGIGIDNKMNRLSYLPLSHSYERMVNYVSILKGLTIYYNESMANIVANFASVKPGILITVPLLLERIYKGIINKQEDLKGVSKVIYKSALRFALSGKDTKTLSISDKYKYRLFNQLVFKKWKAMLGGKVTKIIVGGAAVSPPVYSFFVTIGIPVYEGYGLTEMAPLISYNNTDYNKSGTVGQSLANVMIRISEDGEVLTKGANLMQGYYKHDDLTREVIDEEGWLHTGDVGEIDDDSYLKITGRKKDIFKTSSGIYVYPERIENQLKLSSFVDQVMVVGEYEDYLSTLITLNKAYTLKWAAKNNLPLKMEKLSGNKALAAFIQEDIDKYNESAREAHQIKKVKILSDEWTIDSGELTPSMKLKRKNLIKKYYQDVQSFYESREL